MKIIFLFLFTVTLYAQELKNFQHQLFCVPTQSTLINSLNIVRIGQSNLDWPYFTETIKAKLIFDDYSEVIGTGYEEIKLKINANNSILYFGNSWIQIEVITSKEIWSNNIHNIHLLAYVKQNRIHSDVTYIELQCSSRLSSFQD